MRAISKVEDLKPNDRSFLMVLKSGFGLGGYLPALFAPGGSQGATSYLGQSPRDGSQAMEWALGAAMGAAGLPSPNPSVGCMIVRDQKVVAQGVTQKFGGLHGERLAIQQAPHPEALKGSTAYIMLEPCAHYGKQPPCTEALVQAGVETCVIGSHDPHPLVQGRGITLLKQAGIKVQKSELALECIAFNLPFFFQCLQQRPLIVAKWAQTLNGFLGDDQHGSQWISGPKARQVTHYLRTKYDAILVGAGTVLADIPALTARVSQLQECRQPLKIIFDPSGRLLGCQEQTLIKKLLEKTFSPQDRVLLVYGESNPLPPWLTGHGPNLYVIRVPTKQVAFSSLLNQMASNDFVQWHGLPVQSIFVEGGAALINHLISIDAVDAFQVFLNPSLLNATKHHINLSGTASAQNTRVASMDRYHLVQSTILDQDVFLEFMPKDRYQWIFSKLEDDLGDSFRGFLKGP